MRRNSVGRTPRSAWSDGRGDRLWDKESDGDRETIRAGCVEEGEASRQESGLLASTSTTSTTTPSSTTPLRRRRLILLLALPVNVQFVSRHRPRRSPKRKRRRKRKSPKRKKRRKRRSRRRKRRKKKKSPRRKKRRKKKSPKRKKRRKRSQRKKSLQPLLKCKLCNTRLTILCHASPGMTTIPANPTILSYLTTLSLTLIRSTLIGLIFALLKLELRLHFYPLLNHLRIKLLKICGAFSNLLNHHILALHI